MEIIHGAVDMALLHPHDYLIFCIICTEMLQLNNPKITTPKIPPPPGLKRRSGYSHHPPPKQKCKSIQLIFEEKEDELRYKQHNLVYKYFDIYHS